MVKMAGRGRPTKRKNKNKTPEEKNKRRHKQKGRQGSDTPPVSLQPLLTQSILDTLAEWDERTKNNQGKVLDRHATKIVLHVVSYNIRNHYFAVKNDPDVKPGQENVPFEWYLPAAIKKAAEQTGHGEAQIQRAVDHFMRTHEILDALEVLRKARRARKKPFKNIPREMYSNIKECVREALKELKQMATIEKVRAWVKDRWIDLIPAEIRECAPLRLEMKSTQFHKFLTEVLGFGYCHIRNFVKEVTEERKAVVRNFLMKYASARQREKLLQEIIVYMDETYLHQHHCGARRWIEVGFGKLFYYWFTNEVIYSNLFYYRPFYFIFKNKNV